MLTASMVYSGGPVMTQLAPKALQMLKRNTQALLHERKEDQVSLAEWCGHSKSWINKFLNEDDAEIQLKDLDRMADFFGVSPYQLFQPGISRVTERRKTDRRSGKERRIGHEWRMASRLQSEVDKFPRLARRGDYDFGALPPAIKQIIERADNDIAAYEAKKLRRQVASTRAAGAGSSKGRRGARGPDPKTPA